MSMRIVIIIAAAIGLCPAQTGTTRGPQFEVASVKPTPTPPVSRAYTINETRVDLGSLSLKYLIQLAYKVEAFQVSGPDWLAATRVDILAKPPAGATKEQIPGMLQALLADRFGLVLHREPKEQQIYALIVGKDGPKLKDAAPDNQPDTSFLKGRALLRRIDTGAGDGFWSVSTDRSDLGGGQILDAPRITMPELARTLLPYLDFPVIDMTGLSGPYHVRLDVPGYSDKNANWTGLPQPSAGVPSNSDGGVTIFSSVQKLGLTLEKRKTPVETLVIDHIEKAPTEN
jgi:uncharacterized protein (TIGR03435 family)